MDLQALRDKDREAPEEAAPLTPAQVIENTSQEYDQIQKELNEIEILINQSTSEVEKLAQRNAQLTPSPARISKKSTRLPKKLRCVFL
jgi:hypothetical protein